MLAADFDMAAAEVLRAWLPMSAADRPTPQPGPQTAFLDSPADIVVYGGQAGGGKTWGHRAPCRKYPDCP